MTRNHLAHRTPRVGTIAVSALFLLLAACSSGGDASSATQPTPTDPADPIDPIDPIDTVAATETTDAPVDKAGNTLAEGPLTLTISAFGGQGRAHALVAERFAEEVAELSDGDIIVEVRHDDPEAWQLYADGELDMLSAPTLTMDVLGVSSFDALTLPFVVLNDDQADLVAESPVVETMMAGLESIHSTGLIFAPVHQRHFAVAGDEPLRSIDQLEGGLRLSPPGDLAAEMYRALGATPTYGLNGDDWHAAVADGTVSIGEVPTALAGIVPTPAQVATNFAITYGFNVVIIHNEVLEAMGPERADVLRQAAASAQQRSIDERVREEDAFRDACATGADLTAVPMTLISEIGLTLDDFVLGVLENSPETKSTYDEIKRTVGVYQRTWPNECRDGVSAPYVPPSPAATTFPEGTYRSLPHSEDQLLAAGVGADTSRSNDGWEYAEVTFTDGQMVLDFQQRSGETTTECTAPYTVDAEGLLTVEGDCLGGTYTWHTIDGGIALELFTTDDPIALVDDWDVSTLIYGHLVAVG